MDLSASVAHLAAAFAQPAKPSNPPAPAHGFGWRRPHLARRRDRREALGGPGAELRVDEGLAECLVSLRSRPTCCPDSSARIPYVSKRGAFYYNFWRDAKNPKGLWRRTTFEEYRKPEPKWDVVIDLDALAKEEKENWVWRGAQILKPDHKRCLVALSRGGADATVTREFDLETRGFVAGGFFLPEAKGRMSWIDADHAYVATDFGPGSLTTSGYPRIAKLWTRGTPLSEAKTVYEGQPTDVSVNASYDDTKGFERHLVGRGIAFYKSETFLRKPDGSLAKVEVPEDANLEVHREWMTVELRTP
jgi:prolyl oligopeptidase